MGIEYKDDIIYEVVDGQYYVYGNTIETRMDRLDVMFRNARLRILKLKLEKKNDF